MMLMKYKRDQYNNGFSICALIFAGIFFYFGINDFWNFNVSWISFLWIGIGAAILSSQIAVVANRSKLKNIVLHEFQSHPNISVEEISGNTGISVRDVRAIILDLKAAGRLRGSFSSSTGGAESMQVIKPQPVNQQPVNEKGAYCPNCGTVINRENVVYCSYCGAKL
jgi:hypothetical protein